MRSDNRSPNLSQLLRGIGDVWVTYVKGQFLLALIVGCTTWTVAEAIGLHWAFWLGLIAGVLETVPTFGPLIALVPAVIVALYKGSGVIAVESWVFALIVIAAYLVIQQVSSFLIEPQILGERLDLPPLVVVLAVLGGALLGGVAGAYLAVPVLATLREIARFLRNKRGASPDPAHSD